MTPMLISLKGRTKNIADRSGKYLKDALYKQLFKEGGEERNVRHQLNLFLKSRKRVYKWEVGDTIKKIRSRKHYFAALKEKCARNKQCRSAMKNLHTAGPRSFALIREQMELTSQFCVRCNRSKGPHNRDQEETCRDF